MEKNLHKYPISKEDWPSIQRLYHCKAIEAGKQEECVIAVFSAIQARNYTCEHLCPIEGRCGLTRRSDRRERFVRGVCVVSRGPRCDSLVVGSVG